MTDGLFDYGKSPLSPYQQAREKALQSAAAVLSASSGFMIAATKNPPKSVDDLLKVADWVLGDDKLETPSFAAPIGLAIPSDIASSIYEKLAGVLPDCGHEDCAIHGPANAAKDLNPDDAKSSFDKADDDEPSWEAHGSNPDDEADPRYLSGGEADTVDERIVADAPGWPTVAEWTEIKAAKLPDPDTRSVGERFVASDRTYQVFVMPNGKKFWSMINHPSIMGDDDLLPE